MTAQGVNDMACQLLYVAKRQVLHQALMKSDSLALLLCKVEWLCMLAHKCCFCRRKQVAINGHNLGKGGHARALERRPQKPQSHELDQQSYNG